MNPLESTAQRNIKTGNKERFKEVILYTVMHQDQKLSLTMHSKHVTMVRPMA